MSYLQHQLKFSSNEHLIINTLSETVGIYRPHNQNLFPPTSKSRAQITLRASVLHQSLIQKASTDLK